SGANAGQYTAYTATSGSFLDGVLKGLNKLNNNVTGNGLLDFFANDDNNAFIMAGTKNTADITNSARGEITLSSTFQGSDIPTENGVQTSPFWLDIGHELSHRQDVLKNGATQAGATWLTNPDGTTVKVSEKYATHMENQMRADAGLPLRTHYLSVNQGGKLIGGWGPSRILNAGTRTSTFYGTTYRSLPRILIPKGLVPSSR
ncbi:MAG: type III secretion system effector protein, partial [Prevotella sp.]|nr:type III secretion system effector protein [Prevotella sp.]